MKYFTKHEWLEPTQQQTENKHFKVYTLKNDFLNLTYTGNPALGLLIPVSSHHSHAEVSNMEAYENIPYEKPRIHPDMFACLQKC